MGSSGTSSRQQDAHNSGNSYRHDEDSIDIPSSGQNEDFNSTNIPPGSHFKGASDTPLDRQIEVSNAGYYSRHVEASADSSSKQPEASSDGSSNRDPKAAGPLFRGGSRLANGTTGVIRCSRCTRPLDEQASKSENLMCARCLQKLEQDLEQESTHAESRNAGSWHVSNQHTWGRGGWGTDSWGGGSWSEH